MGVEFASPELLEQRRKSYEQWLEGVTKKRPEGHEFVPTPSTPVHWTPLRKPLGECRVALVTTAGVHLKTQQPFAVYDEEGDWSNRPILGDVATSDLTVTHTHYEARDALRDVNVVFPLDRLRELATEGQIGEVSSLHFGFMGFIPDPKDLLSETAPAAAKELGDRGVDVVLLTGG